MSWDVLNLDEEAEWTYIQIQNRLHEKGIGVLLVLDWIDDNVIVLIGCKAGSDVVAEALGVHEDSIASDVEIGISVVNLFKEKYLRGDL